MDAKAISNVLIMIGFVGFFLFAFDQRRSRARWAKGLLVGTGLIGFALGLVSLLINQHWAFVGDPACNLVSDVLNKVDGLLVGFIVALMISGQLFGTKPAGVA